VTSYFPYSIYQVAARFCDMTSWTPPIGAYLQEKRSYQISSRSDLKRRSLRLF